MHRRTVEILDELRNAQWFSRVGMRDTSRAIVLPSLGDAIACCSSTDSESYRLEASNENHVQVMRCSMERESKWNAIVDMLKKTTIPFVRRKIEPIARDHKLPKVFEDTVHWDILGVCLESEYADLGVPGFYRGLSEWYLNGHFPCGWQGEFPQGMLVIY